MKYSLSLCSVCQKNWKEKVERLPAWSTLCPFHLHASSGFVGKHNMRKQGNSSIRRLETNYTYLDSDLVKSVHPTFPFFIYFHCVPPELTPKLLSYVSQVDHIHVLSFPAPLSLALLTTLCAS